MTAALRSANYLARRGTPRLLVCALVLAVTAFGSEDPNDPWVDRFEPFGGQTGETVAVELTGKNLAAPLRVEFDTAHLVWESGEAISDTKRSGRIRIEPQAALGPHIATLITASGRANSRLFYVDAFPSSVEAEPNDLIEQAQAIKLEPQNLQGAMHELVDIDYFKFEARAGERWTFDVRSLEYGGYLENDLALLDSGGARIAFSDDRDDYLETPFLEYTFDNAGDYYLKLDQYRGPQRVNCAKNCGYMLRVSQLPIVEAAYPLGARAGTTVAVSLRGRALDSIEEVYLTVVRGAEYYRLTFPYTIPVKTAAVGGARITANRLNCGDRECHFSLEIPDDAPEGLWRIWTRGPNGVDDRVSFEISRRPEADSTTLRPSAVGISANGSLDRAGDEDTYTVEARAGQPIVVTSLAAQLGLPYIDTVLELFDSEGKLVAEHDDLMSGQGTVIGNPDSLLHFTPEFDGAFELVVRDRIGRGGPSFVYRLRVEERLPGFALLSDPENLNLPVGSAEPMGVLLVREPGFDEAVDVWVEGLPDGITATQGSFRADQFFGPSGDGDNVIIPEVLLDLTIAENVVPGDYAIRVLGRVPGRGAVVEAISTLWIGPPRKRNDIRRPLPSVLLTVIEAHGEPLVRTESKAADSR